MAPKLEELRGEFQWERHIFPMGCDDRDPQRTVIGELVGGTQVKGKAFAGQLEQGLSYLFSGHWSTHDRYGKQFVFNAFTKSAPASKRGVIKYLKKCRGIGPATAQAAWDRWQHDAVRFIREQSSEAAAMLPHLTEEMATAASEDLQRWQALEAVTIEVTDLLASRSFPHSLPATVIEKWGASAAQKIKENPYLLMQFQSVGFLKCDALYKELGLPLDAIHRQAYALQYAVKQDRTGSTWVSRAMAERLMKELIGGGANFANAAEYAVENDLLRVRNDGGQSWVAIAEHADAESYLAAMIRNAELEAENEFGLTDKSKLYWPDVDTIEGLTEHQRGELRKSLRGRIGIFSGPAGSGKTYTLAKLLKACQRDGIGPVSLLAPTGKAAVRVTESLIEAGLQVTNGQRGRTIASLLFGADPLQPVAVADESSMDDTTLLAGMLGRRESDGHVILIGDPNQLPPVGHGAPLRDLIAAGVPFGQLSEVKRNGGRGLQACLDIVSKGRFTTSQCIDLEADFPENLYLDECRTADEQKESLLEWMQSPHVSDPVWGCQVIVPINERSKVSRIELNKLLQGRLNPAGEQVAKTEFRIRDKVINRQNGYFTPAMNCPAEAVVGNMGVYVANGDQGEVIGTDSRGSMRWMIVRLDTPERIVKVPISKEGVRVDNWELAYAISCHASQGAQWPVVIVMIDDGGSARQLCDKHWLMTGISRFQELCVLIGKNAVAQSFCKKSNMWERKTFLVEKIRELRMAQNEQHNMPELPGR